MTATITNVVADSSGFIPQAWALEALNVLRNQIVLAKVVTTDKDMGEAGWQGKQLNIPYPGTFSAQDKAAGSVATVQAPSGGASVALALSKHKTVDFLVEDYASAQSNSDLLSRYVQPAVIALAEQLETDLWTLYQAMTGSVQGTVGTNLSSTTIRAARQALNNAKAPMQDRYLVMSAKDEVGILSDSTLQNFFAFSDPEAVKSGGLPNLYGFQPYMSQLTPTNSNEVQIVTITGVPTGGTFTLGYTPYGGAQQVTSALAFNAAASAVQTALQALSALGTNVTVSGSAGGPYTVTLAGQPQSSAQPLVLVTNGLTGGTSPSVTIAGQTGAGQLATMNLAFHKSAIMFAMRPFRDIPAGSGVATATVMDDESGLAIRVLKQYSPQYRAEYVGFDILYGFVALRPSLGLVVLS